MTLKLTLIFLLCVSGILYSCSKSDSSPTTSLPSINDANNKAVGASARELLTAQTYTSLKIEIQYMPGFQPDAGAVNNLTTFLNNLLNKPGNISVTQTQIAGSGKVNLTVTELATIEKNNRTSFTSGTQVSVYILITDGQYFEPNVLGVAFRNTSVALMGKTLQDNSGSLGQVSRTKLVTTVLEHELGHLVGLVNLGTAMTVSHQDGAHGNHCSNQSCLMYYASETTDLLGVLLTGNIPPLDQNCINDLKANGGK